MPTTIGQELEEEFLSVIRKSEQIALEALKPLVEAVHYVVPTMPVIRVPLAELLPTAHEAVAEAHHFAEHLLADQRRFADDVITTTSPLLLGRAGSKGLGAKAKAA